MIKPLEGASAAAYSYLDKQPFISEFNITGYNSKNYPNYQAGDFCISWGLVGWVIFNCQSGIEIAFAERNLNVPNCLEEYDLFWFNWDEDIYVESNCVTEQSKSGAAASDTTKVITTESEHPTPKDTEAPVAPFTTTEAPTTQEHVETTLKPCEPCRDVLEGDLAGYYELQSEDDPRCDDGCSYTNQHSQEFCFRPGGFETKLECQ